MKKVIFTIACLLACNSALSAHEIPNNVEFSVGYRHDDFNFKSRSIGLDSDSSAFSPRKFKAHNLDLWEFGLRARYFLQDVACGSNCNLLDNFYLRGYAYWGRASNSQYSEKVHASNSECIYGNYGRIKHYTTQKYLIGVGYLFDLGCLNCIDLSCLCLDNDSLNVGIMGGYSWDRQNLKLKTGNSAYSFGLDTLPNPFFTGHKLDAHWNGGWIGAEFFCSFYNVLWNLGYEYHFATFKATNRSSPFVDLSDSSNGSNHSKKCGYGNVVYLEGTFTTCNCWDLGFLVQWSDYGVDKSRHHASFNSVSILANAGYTF